MNPEEDEFKKGLMADLSEVVPVKSYDTERSPLTKGGEAIGLPDAKIVECDLVEFRMMGEFVVGGKAHKLIYSPSTLEALFGARERYTSQAFHRKFHFTHHIFDSMTDEELGSLVRSEFQKFKQSVEDWKKA
jgi:hypothetical protein